MKKVFAFLSLVVGLGLSSLAMAQGNIDYSGLCKWDETATPRGGQDRVVQSLSFAGATTVDGQALLAQSVQVAGNVTSQRAINFDRTSAKAVNVSKGNTISVLPKFYNLHWTHFYLYIDYNHDGQFAADELVSFTHYREGSSGNFVNSAGESFSSGDVRNGGRLPDFTIPATALLGETRARFKADWNDKNPCGAATLARDRGTICDFTINIQGEEDDDTSTGEAVRFTVNVEGEGTAKIFDVLTQEEVKNLDNLSDPEQLLELRPRAHDGWVLTELKINGLDVMDRRDDDGNLGLMPDGDKTIKVKFERIMETLVYEFNAEGGSVKASLEEDGTPIPSGGKAPLYAKVLYEVEANEGYMLSSVARRNTPDVNVLDEMTKIADNVYVVPVGEDDPGFIFTFVKTDSIEDIKALGYTVRTSKAGVVVEGVSVGTLVELYNVAGVRVAKAIASEAQVALPAAQGMYVLKVGKATAKVAVR